MALLFIDGFDAADMATKWSTTTIPTSSTTTRFSAGRSLSLGSGGGRSVTKYFTASSDVIVGFAAAGLVGGSNNITFMALYTDSGLSSQIVLMSNTNGSLTVARGGTGIATTPAGVVSTGWNYIELKAKVDPTAGNCELRVNGAVVASFTGNTKNTGTSNNIDTVMFTNSATLGGALFDDLYLLDLTGSAPYNTYLGDVRIATLTPDGAGSSTQFTPSTGANYAAVDELPYSASDYVSASASGSRDTYTMSNISGSYTVLAVQNNVIAKKTDAGGTALRSAIKSGATVSYGSNRTLTATDATITDLRIIDPDTSAAWTVSGVNAVEAGMEIV